MSVDQVLSDAQGVAFAANRDEALFRQMRTSLVRLPVRTAARPRRDQIKADLLASLKGAATAAAS